MNAEAALITSHDTGAKLHSGSARWLSTTMQLCIPLLILWLTLKDWFCSDVQQFPYADTLACTAFIAVPSLCVLTMATALRNTAASTFLLRQALLSCRWWRGLILGCAVVLCLASALHVFDVREVKPLVHPRAAHAELPRAQTNRVHSKPYKFLAPEVARALAVANAKGARIGPNASQTEVTYTARFPILAALMPAAALLLIAFGLPCSLPFFGRSRRPRRFWAAAALQALVVPIGLAALIDPISLAAPAYRDIVYPYSSYPIPFAETLHDRLEVCLALLAVAIGVRLTLQAIFAPGLTTHSALRKAGVPALYGFCALLCAYFAVWLIPDFVSLNALASSLTLGQDVQAGLLGTGLTPGSGIPSWSELVGQIGLISLCGGTVLVLVVCIQSARVLLAHTFAGQEQRNAYQEQDAKQAHDMGIGVTAAALTTLTCMPICVASTVPQGYSWIMLASCPLALGVTSLVIGCKALSATQREGHTRRFKPRIAVALLAVLAVGASCSAIALHAVLEKLSAWSASTAPPDNQIPPQVEASALAGMPLVTTWQDMHDALRQTCGARDVLCVRTRADLVGQQFLAAGGFCSVRQPNPLLVTAAGLLVSNKMARKGIVDLYVAGHDYGVPAAAASSPQALNAAAGYYFGERASALTQAQADFLLNTSAPLDQPTFRFQAAPLHPSLTPAVSTRYGYLVLPTPQGHLLHAGALNNKGDVIGMVMGSGIYFMWKNAHLNQLAYSPMGINDLGQTVGGEYLWESNGRARDLGSLPDSSSTEAQALNNRGKVAGYAIIASNSLAQSGSGLTTTTRAFIWENGRITALGLPPGYIASRARAINEAGQIAGWLLTDDDKMHAAVWENGQAHDLGAFPGGQLSIATSINNSGQVVGDAEHGDGSVTAFLWQNGVMHDLGKLPGDDKSRAFQINDSGQVVGESFCGDVYYFTKSRAFIWDSAHGMRDLTPMIAVGSAAQHTFEGNTAAYGINNKGQIIGIYEKVQPRLMFLLTPKGK